MALARGSVGRLVGVVVVAAFPWTCGANDDARVALQQQMKNASDRLEGVCRDAWRYDNLRPTILRAIAPLGTIFKPPEVPVVHLSPGSPDYRQTVGTLIYRYSLYDSQKQRLAMFHATFGTATSADRSERQELWDETEQVGTERDETRANYARACGWAWPYVNLRPRCRQPGIEAATILNPFIPVPVIRLSDESPDYGVVSFSLDYWEKKIPVAETQWNDLLDDHKAVSAALALLKLESFDKKFLRDDERLTKMAEIHRQLKSTLRRWRSSQHKIERLAQPWHDTKQQCLLLQFQTYAIEKSIRKLQLAGFQIAGLQQNLSTQEHIIQLDATIRNLRDQLFQLTPQLKTAREEVAKIEREVGKLREDQSELVQQNEMLVVDWVRLCDIPGRYGPMSHHRASVALNQWIAEEPRGWHLYLARGVANMHDGKVSLVDADLARAHEKIALYDGSSKSIAFMMAVRGYSLCMRNDIRGGEQWFNEAKKTDKTAWMPFFIRGWSNTARMRYPQAKSDFQNACHLAKKSRPETCEAMALLLAASPNSSVRNGRKAIEYAEKACNLTNQSDWICLDTLAAAYAEVGDFDSAVASATQSLQYAPQDKKDSIEQRLAMYRAKKTYRLK